MLLEKRVEFGTGSKEIGSVSESSLDEVATAVKGNADIKRVQIMGHADSTGSSELNEQLAAGRAESTKDYLVGQGVPEEKITTQSFSDTSPIASNDSAVGRALNRSAAVIIVK